MATVKAPTLAASVNRLIVARATLPGQPPRVDFRTAQKRGSLRGFEAGAGAEPPRARRGGRHLARLFRSLSLFFLACTGCVSKSSLESATVVGGARKGEAAHAALAQPADPLVWQAATTSPEPGAAADRLPFCGEPDAALARVAARLARRQSRGDPAPEGLELSFLLRAEGEPHVWPHAWTLSGETLDPSDEAARLHRYLDSLPEAGVRRCGVARSKSTAGDETVAVVVVSALADLAPVATRARAGQWLRFDARMLVPATSAKLIVLGPDGSPRNVPTTLHEDQVEATFAVERAGPFAVQLLANTDRGPRPVLEASVFVDVAPPTRWVSWPAPGESESVGTRNERDALRAMVNAARATEELPALAASDTLDRSAGEQARAMLEAHVLAHDAGEGGPAERLRRLGVSITSAGENVAHEMSLARAHRALWWSPSHRGNLLDPRFHELGVGVARDPDGSLWICELFADFADTGIVSPAGGPSIFRMVHAK
jgi:uncharacterized protein YkwD